MPVHRLGEDLKIGSQMLVGATNVLCTLRRTVALTNIAPIVRGHAIVMPVSGVGRTAMLDDDEWLDLWRTALLAQQSAELSVGADASNLLLREGAHAAWADAPAHLHVVPRLLGDFARNDAVFDAMQTWMPPGVEASGGPPPWSLPDDAERRDRTTETMTVEAASYRALMAAEVEAVPRAFGRFTIPSEHVFFDSTTRLSQAFVNLRPLAPGHVLVTPRRVVARLCELSHLERDDLFGAVRTVARAVAAERAAAMAAAVDAADIVVELGVQDGRTAGQSVPHVHCHVIPRG